MSEQLNNGLKNIDDFLRNSLNNYQAELSPNLWGKMKLKLFKNDVSEFVRFKKFKQAFHPNCKSVTLQLKIWSSYAAAACLTVGIVYGSTYYINNIINSPEIKTKKEIVPANPKSLIPPINNAVVDSHQMPEISKFPEFSKIDHKQTGKQDNPLSINSKNIVETNVLAKNNTDNTFQKENTNPIVSNNFKSLINYIQRLNPQDKIITSENTDKIIDEADVVPENNIPISSDTQMNVIEGLAYQIEIPNVITPNGDGFNDVLIINNLDKYIDNNLLIADRAGKIVYERNSYQNDWDAKNLPDGTYYYILSYKNKNNNKGVIKGLITIIR